MEGEVATVATRKPSLLKISALDGMLIAASGDANCRRTVEKAPVIRSALVLSTTSSMRVVPET